MLEKIQASFFDLSVDLLCVAGTDGYFKKINHRWVELLGHPESELCSRPMTDFIHPDDIQATIEVRKNFENGQNIVGFQNRYRCLDGTYKKFEWTAKKEGQFVIGVARDITTRYRKERLAVVGEFASSAGHEINNPLMIANGQVERIFKRLKDNNQLDEKYLEFQKKYSLATDRIARVVTQLREISSKDSLEDNYLDSNQTDQTILEERVRNNSLHIKLPKKKVLIVEDELELAELVQEAIQCEEVEVQLAINGLAALEELSKNRFDVIITDQSMPIMDGKTLIENIYKQKLASPDTRIYLLTGAVHSVFSANDLEKEYFKTCEIIAKPVNGLTLRSLILKKP